MPPVIGPSREFNKQRHTLTYCLVALPFIGTLFIPSLASFVRVAVPNWVSMWLLALVTFATAKWVTLTRVDLAPQGVGVRRLLGYLFLWPGMNARTFFGEAPTGKPAAREWIAAAVKTLLGTAILRLALARPGSVPPVFAAWLGMAGLVLLLHFGLFHLLSILWRTVGVSAAPIMRSPLSVTSLSTFWGGGWNIAFRDLMHESVFKPLSRKVGAHYALLAVFVVSGLLHELVITVPAHGGYGLPTAYFLLQYAGICCERSKVGRRLGLAHGIKGWCFVILFTALPAYWLFPPVFVQNVIVPMLRTIAKL